MAKLDLKKALSGQKRGDNPGAKHEIDSTSQVEPKESVKIPTLADSAEHRAADKVEKPQRSMKDRHSKIVDVRNLVVKRQARSFGLSEGEEHITQEEIETLAEKIKAENNGKIKSPILLERDGDDDLVFDGETRKLACEYLAKKEANEEYYFQPARYTELDEIQSDDKDLFNFKRILSQANINGSGRDLRLKTKLALAVEGQKRGLTLDEIGAGLGMKKGPVSRLLKISTYPESIREMIFSGDLAQSGRVFEKVLKEALAAEQTESNPENIAGPQITSDTDPGPVLDVPVDNDSDESSINEEPKAKPKKATKEALEAVATSAKKEVAEKKASPKISVDEDVLMSVYDFVSFAVAQLDPEMEIDRPTDRKEIITFLNEVPSILLSLKD